ATATTRQPWHKTGHLRLLAANVLQPPAPGLLLVQQLARVVTSQALFACVHTLNSQYTP
ncbi:hypothetical protein HAX54_000251, partial [Datura stramonium]|nr:hypothetical protein [Datura stramonium]